MTSPTEPATSPAGAPRRVDAIDWSAWTPVDRATLTFVRRQSAADPAREDVLLITKKRGLGAGKINAPGGRLEGDETPAGCAVREVEEEVGVTPLGVEERGRLRFQFVDGYSLDCHVFQAFDHRGEPRETDEAIPQWTPIDAIPFDRMWADDHLWLPALLAGRRVDGCFIFDGDTMLDHALTLED
ncbi:MAG: NUDIX domain-containing protein [Acidobacteriota bacterium]